MIEILKHYCYAFLHPVKTQLLLREHRVALELNYPLKIVKSEDDIECDEGRGSLSLPELLGVSWLFVIIKSIYAMITIFIGVALYSEMVLEGSSYLGFLEQFSVNTKKWALFSVLLDAVFFPFYGLGYVKIWELLIRLFSKLYGRENIAGVKQVVSYSLVSNLFLLIPIIGGVARFFASIFYLFVGLKKNLGFSRLQSVIILISPIVFLSFVIFLLIIYWVLIISVMLS